MTGVGQLPCADTPSPIPRLASPDAHMSPSLLLSLWELQHGCLRWSEPRACWWRENICRSRDLEEDLCQEDKKASSRVPALALHLTQSPHHSPRLTAARGVCLLSGSRTGKPSLAPRRGGNHIPPTLPTPNLGKSWAFINFPWN